MIAREAVLRRIDTYLAAEHPELIREWVEMHMPYFVEDMRAYPFLTLAEALDMPGPLHFSHNGMAHTGLSFEEVASFFGHPNPAKIPPKNAASDRIYHRTVSTCLAGVSEYSYVTDENPDLSAINYYYLFLEGVFGIRYGAFRSTIVEAGYGMRLDREGQIAGLVTKILDEKIPFLVGTVDIGEGEDDHAYVINGFEI